MKRFLALFAAGLLLVGLAVWLAFGSVRPGKLPGSAFATRAEAEQSGALREGWFPSFIPEGASNLRELHDPLTTRTWGSFALASPGWAPPRGVQADETGLRGPYTRIKWWPKDAEGKVTSRELAARGFRVTLVDEARGPVFVAVRGTEVLFWRFARAEQ